MCIDSSVDLVLGVVDINEYDWVVQEAILFSNFLNDVVPRKKLLVVADVVLVLVVVDAGNVVRAWQHK